MKDLLCSALRHGVLLAVCVAACSPIESSPELGEASWNMQSGSSPGPLAPGVMPPAPPGECRGLIENPCKRYRIPLVGNPITNEALRDKYIAAFGNACYISADDIPTFNCFYKKWQKACADAVMIGEVSGNAPYDTGYMCQPSGNGDYSLQVGSDVASKIFIYYEDAPPQSPKIDVGGVPTEVNGPYRNLPEPEKLGPGRRFNCEYVGNSGDKVDQRTRILEMNRNKNSGEIHSDLVGFMWPCEDDGIPKTCTEQLVLKDPAKKGTSQYDPQAAQVHHVVPMKDKRLCPWGTNSNKNAAVVSRALNIYLTNNEPPADEVVQINNIAPYMP